MYKKAISLISGGLDSALATRLILDQGIEVVGLNFTSPFSSKRERSEGLQAIRTARELGIRLILKEKGPEYIDVIRKPKHGYGKNMNPCIDCRIFMLRKTKEVMAKEEGPLLNSSKKRVALSLSFSGLFLQSTLSHQNRK
jgi:tRNA-specific 2-thiouridylase